MRNPLLLVSLVLPLAGCLSDEQKTVSAAEFGDAWPLTEASGTVDCDHAGRRTIRLSNGVYALNGAASDYGFPPIDRYWRDDPSIPGAKINIRPLIEKAGEFCD